MRVAKLPRKDLEKIIDQLRKIDTSSRDLIAPIIWHVRWQEERIKTLESDLHKLRQSDLFIDRSKEFEQKRNIAFETGKLHAEEVKKHGFHPLRERIKMMIREGKIDTDDWNRMLKWNGLTKDQAISMGESNEAEELR